jgi:hypothetical protein
VRKLVTYVGILPILFGVIVATVLVFQARFIDLSFGKSRLSSAELSGLYTRALGEGHSYLLSNPGEDHIIHDSSLYHGKEYMYFGIVPFITFMVPFYELTGYPPPPGAAVLIFLGVGYLGYGAILLLFFRRGENRVSLFMGLLAFSNLLVCNGTWFLLGQALIYEIENAAAFAFMSLALLCLTVYEVAAEKRIRSLCATAFFAALVIGCRPDYLPAVSLIVLWIGFRAFGRRNPLARRVALAAVALTPLLLVAIGLAWWNYHRFDSPSDFGILHTRPVDPKVVQPVASAIYSPYFIYRYIVGRASLIRYFPFIQGQAVSGIRPALYQQDGDEIYGFMVITPILLLGVIPMWLRSFQYRNAIPWLGLLLLGMFAGNLVFLCLIAIGCYRYPADFLAPLTLLASLSIGEVDGISGPILRRSLKVLIVPTLLWSLLCSLFVMFSIAQNNVLLDLQRSRYFESIAHLFNSVVYEYERLAHDPPRGLAITVQLPNRATGTVEPILVDGQTGAEDFLYFYYASEQTLQIGFESSGFGGVKSDYLTIDYTVPHCFEIYYGSYLPPDDHPLMGNISKNDAHLARQMITLRLDGKVVLDGTAKFHATRGYEWIGLSPTEEAFGRRFSGRIIKVERPPILPTFSPRRWEDSEYGSLSLNLAAAPMPSGVCDPIVSMGMIHQGSQLVLEQLGGTMVRILWLSDEGHRINSEPFSWPSRQTRRVTVSLGSLYPPTTSSLWLRHNDTNDTKRLKTSLRVRVDGDLIIDSPCYSKDVSPESVSVGIDSLHLRDGVIPHFDGEIRLLGREPW